MDSPNPYTSPQAPSQSGRDDPASDARFSRYLPLLSLGLLAGCVLSFFNPLIGVPVTLFAMPALVRGTRVYWRKRRAAAFIQLADWGLLITISTFIAIPISAVGLITFCCVCAPTGYLLANVAFSGGHNFRPTLWFQVPIFLGLFAGLFASLFLLRGLSYLSKEEKEGMRQTERQTKDTDFADDNWRR